MLLDIPKMMPLAYIT
uniref:Uncharacterized protein n=1 Tax=Anguilla anguilla TaxID=7936 RepID=A0A0E9VGG6_ANGAN